MEERIDAGQGRLATSELVYRIRALIRDQELQPGERLGSERALAQSLGISRSDLRMALAVLEASHEVIRKIGRAGGIVVSDGRLERNINTVESLPTIARRQGMRVSSKVLQAFRHTVAETARRASDGLRHHPSALYRRPAAVFGTFAPARISVSDVPDSRADHGVLHDVRA